MGIPANKIVITGVSGLVGFHLADRLCRLSPRGLVVGISRSENGNVSELRRHPNFRFAPIDLTTAKGLDELLAGTGMVYHLAAQSAVYRARQDPLSDLRINIQGTLQLVLSAARVGVPKVVFTSGGAVYESQAYALEEDVGHPPSFYGAGKLAAESYLQVASQTLGLRHTILRLSRVYGPRMVRGAIYDLIQDFQAHRPANMFAPPDSVFDFVYVQDAVSALLLASGESWDGTTANVSSGKGVRLRDLHATFVDLFGYEVPLHPIEGAPTVEVLVNDRARSLGWEPECPLEKGLRETLCHFLPESFCR